VLIYHILNTQNVQHPAPVQFKNRAN